MFNSAVMLLFSSNTIYIVMTCFILTLILIANELNIKLLKKKLSRKSDVQKYEVLIDDNNNGMVVEQLKEAPGPKPKFLVGNLDIFNGFEIPYQAFTQLKSQYGDVIKLQMGSVPSMVINGIENIKEVLVTKGMHFSSRPDFRRYHLLFNGDKNNSVAFCDWSDVTKTRRDMMSTHTFPRKFSMNFDRLSDITGESLQKMSVEIKHSMEHQQSVSIKPLLQVSFANIFTTYFTTRSFDKSDSKFLEFIQNFDKIFWEMNQGYAADFLPFLMPFQRNNMKKMQKCSHEIREFVIKNIVSDRLETWNAGEEPNDYIESLIDHIKQDLQPRMDMEQALFTLEDIIGGHAANVNFLVKVLAILANHKDVQRKVQAEVDELLSERSEKSVLMTDRNKLIYTEAVIMESLRLISSPLVPHVAAQDSTIDGYSVKAGTLLFLNNYDLNMSPSLWDEPEKFEPKRFISNGKLLKPNYFIPFGMGTRGCMGYKIVQFLSFAIVGNLLKEFDISPLNNEDEIKVPLGSLANSENPYQLAFSLRT